MEIKSSNYGSLQFQAWIFIISHGRNLYEFQRSKPFSKLHLLYLYPLSKQSFPNYSQNARRSSLRISRSILHSPTAPKQVLPHSFHLSLNGTWHKIRHAFNSRNCPRNFLTLFLKFYSTWIDIFSFQCQLDAQCNLQQAFLKQCIFQKLLWLPFYPLLWAYPLETSVLFEIGADNHLGLWPLVSVFVLGK